MGHRRAGAQTGEEAVSQQGHLGPSQEGNGMGSTRMTRPSLFSCPVPPDITTAWTSSATMTCWMQPQA